MKYLGNYQNNNLPKQDLPKLFCYLDEREIIISYNAEHPFFVEQISILIDSMYNTYAVFECGKMCNGDKEAKDFGEDFAQALINFIEDYNQ